jgi:hypothetical protein
VNRVARSGHNRGGPGLGPRDSVMGACVGSGQGLANMTSRGDRPADMAGLSDRPYPENLVKFFQGERVIAGGYGAEDFRVELDLIKRHAVVDTQIETLSHRAHLRC